MGEPLIVQAIRRYYPEWCAPADNGRTWISCLCPWHGDSTKSASVSFQNNAYRCFACEVRGDAIALIMREEGVPYRAALKLAEGLSSGSDNPLPQKPDRQPGRRIPAGPRSVPGQPAGRQVPARVRRGPRSWPRAL